jgi:hypothetical protein
MRVQRVLMPGSDTASWTVLGDDQEPVERFLGYLTSIEKSPNTVKAYAHDLKDWFTHLARPRSGLAGRHGRGRGRVRRLAQLPLIKLVTVLRPGGGPRGAGASRTVAASGFRRRCDTAAEWHSAVPDHHRAGAPG